MNWTGKRTLFVPPRRRRAPYTMESGSSRRVAMIRVALIVPLLAALVAAQEPKDKPEAFTFLFWTDQELDPGKEAKLAPTLSAMHGMAGKALPSALGGNADAP